MEVGVRVLSKPVAGHPFPIVKESGLWRKQEREATGKVQAELVWGSRQQVFRSQREPVLAGAHLQVQEEWGKSAGRVAWDGLYSECYREHPPTPRWALAASRCVQ